MRIETNKSLKDLNTFNVESIASQYAEVSDTQDIQELIKEGIFQKPFLILGGGSNTLFSQNFNGTVVKINIQGKEILNETDTEVTIRIYAGEDWPQIVEWSVKNNYEGIQNLALIPGTTGATPIQNVGAYGVEIKDVLEEVEVINLQTGEISTMRNADCQFKYRDSIFKHELKDKVIVTSITIKLKKTYPNSEINPIYLEYGGIQKELETNFQKPYTLEKVFNAVCNIRNEKLPKVEEYGSCGSTFQNPIITQEQYQKLLKKYPELPKYEIENSENVKIPAAYILEQIGWKNRKTENGKCGTWIKHPLIVTNYNNATGEEILKLIKDIQEDFFDNTGIQLNTETNII